VRAWRDAIVEPTIGAPPTTRLRLERDERREQILAAARRLFAERPPAEVSATDIAREAGVARGLLHHYFNGKDDLHREAVRSMLRYPAVPDGDISTAIEGWLTMVSRNRVAWLAALTAHDPDIEAVVEEARGEAVERLLTRFAGGASLRPVLRAYSAFAEQATIEWLVRRRLTRRQTHDLLLSTLTHLTGGNPP
jgi:AcrR family transcriptional regulator